MWTLLFTSKLKNSWRSKLSKILCRPRNSAIGSDKDGVRGIVCSYSCDTKRPRLLLSSTLTNKFDLSNSLFHRKLASIKVIPQHDGDIVSRRKTSWQSYVKDAHSHFRHTHTDTAGCEKNKVVSNLSIFLMTVLGVVLFHVAKRTSESLCEEDVREEGKQIDGEISNYQNGLKIANSTNSSACKSDQRQHISLEEAIKQAKDLCQRVKDESGSPGLVMAVSVNGKIVMSDGFGFADVENRVPCTPDSVMRIASISKSLTMAAVAKAVENNTLDLDKPVQEYVPQFPEKEVNGEKVTVTTRQLVSHLGGIRHYDKKYMQKDETQNLEGKTLTNYLEESSSPEVTEKSKVSSANPLKNLKLTKEFEQKEYFIRKHYASVEKSLDIFKNDPLVHKPGTKFLYTTHGWTLVAAVLEGATKQKFPDLMIKLFKDLGLENTYLEKNQPIIYNRAKFYARSKKNQLVNAPYVECSHKFAGGGMMSTAPDLVRFGNAMLYSYQLPETINLEQSRETERSGHVDDTGKSTSDCRLPGYLKKSTMQQIWSPVSLAKYKVVDDGFYAMGWAVVPEQEVGCGRKGHFYVSHTGGAVGASSVLLIIPSTKSAELGEISCTPPQGVVVAMIVNMISVSLLGTALKIAKLFEDVSV